MALRRFVCCLLLLLVSGCAFSRTPSPQTVRTATEQLLLSQAIERSLHDLSVPLAEGSTVMIETVGFVPPTAFIPSDLNYARDTVAGRLGQLGFRIHPKDEEPRYLVRVLVQTNRRRAIDPHYVTKGR